VAHEVRNPLGILRGQIELLGERLGPDAAPRERERITEMIEEIDRLAAVSDELLTLGRDAGAREVVAVVPLLEGVARRVTRVTPRAEVAVSAPPELTVVGDPVKLGQAVFNLALNAAQIGGDAVRIRLGAAATADEVTLTVADDGPGVPPALRARLFEPFVSGRQEGRGLGLSMARQVAERHGGRLELEPTPRGARGAVFSLRLPRTGGEPWRGS
jgi:two-component system OmpR family sensor kinase